MKIKIYRNAEGSPRLTGVGEFVNRFDTTEASLLVDTGAAVCLITDDLIDELNLLPSRRKITFSTVAGDLTAPIYLGVIRISGKDYDFTAARILEPIGGYHFVLGLDVIAQCGISLRDGEGVLGHV